MTKMRIVRQQRERLLPQRGHLRESCPGAQREITISDFGTNFTYPIIRADKSREAVSKSFAPPPEDSEDEEDEEDEEDSDDNTKATPVGSKRAPISRLSLRAAHSDEGDDDLPDDSIMDQSGRLSKLSNDSIMDEDSDEEDAEEVDDLL